MNWPSSRLASVAALLLPLAALSAAERIPLWSGQPPQFLEGAPAEFVERHGLIKGVTTPSLTVFPAPKD